METYSGLSAPPAAPLPRGAAEESRPGAVLIGLLAMLLMLFGCDGSQRVNSGTPAGGGEGFELFVLGTAQDGGLPHVGCTKQCCVTARRSGRELYPVSLGIHDRASGASVLIEATPRIEPQLALFDRLTGREAVERRPVDALLLTHAHIGHYLGLAQFGREVASTRELPTYVSPAMAAFLSSNGPWSQLVRLEQIRLKPFTLGEPFSPIPGLSVTAVEVPHRQEYSDTVAFRIEGPRKTVLFVPDIDSWDQVPGLLDRLVEGVDVAYLDATWYDGRELPGRDMSEIPHPTVVHTMQLLGDRALATPGRYRFLHLNHTNPLLHDEALRHQIEAHGFRLAVRGERVPL